MSVWLESSPHSLTLLAMATQDLQGDIMPARIVDTPVQMSRRLASFIGAIEAGYAPEWRRNLRGHTWLGKTPTDRSYVERIELGMRVRTHIATQP